MTETENVATYARIRPYNPAINEDKRLTARCCDGNKILNQNGDNEDTYNFTKVFDMKHSTEYVFESAMRPLLDYKILQGINSIFIVYGQSGSGKSFTLIGEEGNLGVLPMSLQYLLKQDCVQRIDIAAIEAYGIKAAKIGFYDLVSQLALKENNKKLKKGRNNMRDIFDPYKSKDNSYLNSSNAKLLEITDSNCLSIIIKLQEVSHMAPTLKNPHSSRGHTVYFCKIKMKDLEDVYFIAVDLAGSEGQTALGTKDEFCDGLKLAMNKGKLHLSKKKMVGVEQMYKTRSLEAGCINNGLTQLQSMFNELIKKKISKSQGLGLRKVLSSFISLKSSYSILFTLSASANNTKVTKATLNFAKQTQLVKVETKRAKKKIDKDRIIKELNELIGELRKEMAEKDKTIQQLQEKESDDYKIEMNMNKKQESIFDKFDDLNRQITESQIEEAKWTVHIENNDITKDINTISQEKVNEIFQKFDKDGNGTICNEELYDVMKEMGKELTMNEINDLIQEVDENKNGVIDQDEFKVMIELKWFIDAFQERLLERMDTMMTMMMTDMKDGDQIDLSDIHDIDDNEDDMKINYNENKEMKEIMRLQNEMVLLKRNMEKQKQELSKKNKEREDLRKEMESKINMLQNENDALKKKRDNNNDNNMDTLKEEIDSLKQTVNILQTKNNGNYNTDKMNELRDEIKTLRNENARLKLNALRMQKQKKKSKFTCFGGS